jgi:hypothetical protein
MSMRKLVIALALVGLSALPAFAQAADFKTTDADGDGQVTLEEGTAAGFKWTEEQFAAADADSNGVLSEAEFATAATMEAQ